MPISTTEISPASARPLFACSKPSRGNLPTSLLILNRQGRIVHGNQEWFRLIEILQLTGPSYRVGGDYLAACLAGWGMDIPEIRNHGISIAAIMQGGGQEPAITYSCMIAGERRRFSVSSLPLRCIVDDVILVTYNETTGDIQRKEAPARRVFFDWRTGLPN